MLDAGWDVAVLDNLATGFQAAVPPAVRFYQGDIRDAKFLDRVFRREKCAAVIHFAAYSCVSASMKDPLAYYDNNLNGTRSLLAAMVNHNVNKLIFSSTAAVYGEPEQIPIVETHPVRPTNAYGATKLAMEEMMRWCEKAYGLRYVALRYFNAGGAHPSGALGEAHDPESHLIPLILQVPCGKKECITVFGADYPTRDGTCLRDYIHVMDLADAHMQAVTYLLAGGQSDVFNLGSGVGFTVREVLTQAEATVGKPIAALVEGRRAGDPAQLVASGEKARRVLGWQPTRSTLGEIIASAWHWQRSHPNGFR
jgi:UDP-glucose 4-epimerase